eukprot:6581345-Prymnesium_polylepis.1
MGLPGWHHQLVSPDPWEAPAQEAIEEIRQPMAACATWSGMCHACSRKVPSERANLTTLRDSAHLRPPRTSLIQS